MQDLLQIGEIADQAGVNIQTLRYYERRHILMPAVRKESGYRLYKNEAVKQVRFIKKAQDLGFSLEEIRDLLSLKIPSVKRCDSVRSKTKQKLRQTQAKIKQLQNIEKILKRLVRDCEQRKVLKECPILNALGE